MFFEGSEKKIEVIFSPQLPSLRAKPREFWTQLVQAAQAQILSEISNESMTAFLLSESSLFIYDHRLVMITCGTTCLVSAVEKLMEFFKPHDILAFFYERKNELLPRVQTTDFFKDVEILKKWFKGEAMRYGREDEHHLYLFASNGDHHCFHEDHTMEILMHGMNPQWTELFCGPENWAHRSSELRKLSGLNQLVQGQIDDHLFEPMGYSLNAIEGPHYFTIHITPEKDGSYASFETNRFGKAMQEEWAKKVLQVFQPMGFDLMLFNSGKIEKPHFQDFVLKRQFAENLKTGYNTQYFSFYRPDGREQVPFKL